MKPDLINAACLRDYFVYLEFDDGLKGVIDLEPEAKRDGVFEPLHDTRYFKEMELDKQLGTITWPNGADISPFYLYDRLKKETNTATASP